MILACSTYSAYVKVNKTITSYAFMKKKNSNFTIPSIEEICYKRMSINIQCS